jgi:hypothetical protein
MKSLTHLSYLPGNSFNDCIDEQLTTVQFSKFDNFISIIQTLGEHAKIGKNVFLSQPCYPGDQI